MCLEIATIFLLTFGDFNPQQLKNLNFCPSKVFVSIVEKYNRVCYTDVSNFPSNVIMIKNERMWR
jgi:hypothetical protein